MHVAFPPRHININAQIVPFYQESYVLLFAIVWFMIDDPCHFINQFYWLDKDYR